MAVYMYNMLAKKVGGGGGGGGGMCPLCPLVPTPMVSNGNNDGPVAGFGIIHFKGKFVQRCMCS